jgi:hypothetical protein
VSFFRSALSLDLVQYFLQTLIVLFMNLSLLLTCVILVVEVALYDGLRVCVCALMLMFILSLVIFIMHTVFTSLKGFHIC